MYKIKNNFCGAHSLFLKNLKTLRSSGVYPIKCGVFFIRYLPETFLCDTLRPVLKILSFDKLHVSFRFILNNSFLSVIDLSMHLPLLKHFSWLHVSSSSVSDVM